MLFPSLIYLQIIFNWNSYRELSWFIGISELTVIGINSGTHKNFKPHVQDTRDVQESRASVHKRVTHTSASISFTI